MIVTINTDASFSPDYHIGSYAFWIVCDHERIKQGGLFKDPCINPSHAEFKCIINAIYILGNMNYQGISKVIINTDSTDCIYLINGDPYKSIKYKDNDWRKGLKKKFQHIISKFNLGQIPIECRHVKAHVSTNTKREYCNEWCDQEAKKHLRLAVQIRKENEAKK